MPPATTNEPIAADVLDARLDGIGLSGATLRAELRRDVVLLTFLRHFGCSFCRELVGRIRDARAEPSSLPRVLYVTLGTPDEGRVFFARFDPGAAAISDPEAWFYERFALKRGGLAEFFAPSALGNGLRVLVKGHLPGMPVGDVRRMPGVFLVSDAVVRWKHVAEHAGDEPDLRSIAETAARLRADRPPRA